MQDVSLAALSETLYIGDNTGSKKPLVYLTEYQRLFAPIRLQPLRIVEIGVQGGWSMLMWREFFPNATIVGIDRHDCPDRFPKEERFRFVQGDQGLEETMQAAIEAAGGPIDIVIDDASHLGFLTALSFRYLFPAVAPGGLYIVEDICTAFTGCGDFDDAPFENHAIGMEGEPKVFPSHQHGVVGFMKQLADFTQEPVARKADRWEHQPIFRVTFTPNMVTVEKAPAVLMSTSLLSQAAAAPANCSSFAIAA